MNQGTKIAAIITSLGVIGYFLISNFNGDNPQNNSSEEWRNKEKIIYSQHAECRMDCRKIDRGEVSEILENGKWVKERTQKSSQGVSYALEGTTSDQQNVRIVVAPKEEKLVVVTVIDLDKDWPCDCK